MDKSTPHHLPRLTGQTVINDHNLYWEFYGPDTGPTVVLLHYGLGSIRSWNLQIPDLVESGFNVLAIDRWGYGRSDSREAFEPYFLHHDAEETVYLLKTFGIKQASLIGHSDGGSIALIIASRYPNLVQNLILIAAHVYVEQKLVKALKLIKIASQTLPFSRVLEREHGDRAKSLVQAWLDCWFQHGPLTIDLNEELEGVSCPTLVIQGEQDEYASPQHARDIATWIETATLWLIPDVGHMPPQEIPEEFNRTIIDFLKESIAQRAQMKWAGSESEHVQQNTDR